MKKLNKSFVLLLLSAIILTGCGTTQLQTRAKLTRTITLDKSKKQNRNIYVQVSNTAGSGGENLKLYDDLKTKLQAKGYTLVTTSKDASYGLFVNVLFANNLKEANAIKSAVSSGVLAGGSTAIGGGSGSSSLIVGALAALGGGIIGSAMEDDIFRAVIDVEIRDYKTKDAKIDNTIYNKYLTRVFIEAVRMNLKLNEALPILSSKASTEISNLF